MASADVKEVYVSDEVREKTMVSFIGFHLLKNGYTPESVARALFIPESFTKPKTEHGVKSFNFASPSKICKKELYDTGINAVQFDVVFMFETCPCLPSYYTDGNGAGDAELLAYQDLKNAAAKTDGFDGSQWLLDVEATRSFDEELQWFARERCELGSKHQCDVKEFYSALESYCKERSIELATTQAVGKKIKQLFPNVDTVKYRTANGFSRKYLGIGIKS